jgi:GT2 family glycosyltransferase
MNDMLSDLSIVIVNWNVADWLRRCIQSITKGAASVDFDRFVFPFCAKFITIEIIVVDCGSEDNSVDVLQHYPQVKWIDLRENVGFAKGCNIGLTIARGRYLMLLNPDTEIINDSLLLMVDFLDKNPTIGILGPKTINSDGTCQPTRRRFHDFKTMLGTLEHNALSEREKLEQYYISHLGYDDIFDVDWVQGSALMIRRKLFDEIGGLDEIFFMYYEDIDWCKRAKNMGARVVFFGNATVLHHQGKSSIQNKKLSRFYYEQSKIKYFFKHYGVFVGCIVWTLTKLNRIHFKIIGGSIFQ